MKKRQTHYTKDLAIVLLLFALAIATLNLTESSLYTHIAGIIFLIAGALGAVSLIKTGRFMYDK